MSHGQVIDAVAKAEGWHIAATTIHDDDVHTKTLVKYDRGVIHIRYNNGRVTGVSWLNKENQSPTVILASDSWLDTACAVLTGDRT